jgi:hypothetical protein
MIGYNRGMIETQTSLRPLRSSVFLTAMIEVAGSPLSVRMRNLSEGGALIEGNHLPEEGTCLIFHKGDLTVSGRIAWMHGNRCGIQFDQKLTPETILTTMRVITKHAAAPPSCKRPGFSQHSLSAAERALAHQWGVTIA